MKFRRLTREELEPLENELKQFLIINGVHSEEWEIINKENPARANELVDIFSDTVLQKVYEKLEFLEHRSVPTCMVFRCLPDKIDLIVMQRKPESSIDLSTAESIHQALMSDLNSITFYTSSRAYVSEREMEIHQLLEQGCLLSSSDFWVQLNAIVEINRTDHN